ncbi:MAG: hypothetical protein JSW39_04650 [Desulfobacterales bacterium]|nr:MAG: hypothetical protein JSW39_04650 [Desulfobacterales bacterium]
MEIADVRRQVTEIIHKEEFPAKCCRCFMPESFFSQNCLAYHQVLQDLKVDTIGDGANYPGAAIRTYHLSGHSPDCLAVLLGDEAIVVGDIVLPEISPWPTCEASFGEVAEVLQPEYGPSETLFGLRRYIKSLKKLMAISQSHPAVLILQPSSNP